jgi:hypothetical protein
MVPLVFADLNVELTAKSQYAFGGSCDGPIRSMFCAILIDPTENTDTQIPCFTVCFTSALPLAFLSLSLSLSKFQSSLNAKARAAHNTNVDNNAKF